MKYFHNNNNIQVGRKPINRQNQEFNEKLKKKVKYPLIILVFVICTPLYIRQYVNTYTEPSERKNLSVTGILLD